MENNVKTKSRYLYYVMDNRSQGINGPFTLKEAIKVRDKRIFPASILMKVIDENGKEVK